MGPTEKDVKKLKLKLRRLPRTESGTVRWTPEREGLIREIGEFAARNRDLGYEGLAKILGMGRAQLGYVLTKYRKLPRLRARSNKPKLAPVKIVDDNLAAKPRSAIELVLENGMKVSMGSTEQVVELLEQLGRWARVKSGVA